MGNKAAKEVIPDYDTDEGWVCGPTRIDPEFPPTNDKKKYLTKHLNEQALSEDPEFDIETLSPLITKTMEPLKDDFGKDNPYYVFYLHDKSPTYFEENINFEICTHCSLFKYNNNCYVFSPTFRSSSQELQRTDIERAFYKFTQVLDEKNKITPFFVAGQGFNSRILYDLLLKLDDQFKKSLILALLPGYPLPLNNKEEEKDQENDQIWFSSRLIHWRTFQIGSTEKYIFEKINIENNNNKNKKNKNKNKKNSIAEEPENEDMTNPGTFNNDLAISSPENNIGSLQIVLISDEKNEKIKHSSAVFRYYITSSQIVASQKTGKKGIQLIGKDDRLEDAFGHVQSEYLVYWLALRTHLKPAIETFYHDHLGQLQKAHEDDTHTKENFEDL